MIEYLRVPESGRRDWRNLDAIDRPAGLAWPWPEEERSTLRERISRLLSRFAGVVGSLPPQWQEDRAESRP